MSPAEREEVILQRAVEHFAAVGFEGSTRELAARIGVTQSLLYKYFPSKEVLIDRVYERVYMERWDPAWEEGLGDRSVQVSQRLKRFYFLYAHAMLARDWVRILVFAGVKNAGINERLFRRLKERIFRKVVDEVRHEMRLPAPRTKAEAEMELELVWALHASIFYLGMRRWVYGTSVPANQEALVEALVEGFLVSFVHHATQSTQPGRS